MSQKEQKKIRRLYRKDIGARLRKHMDQYQHEIEDLLKPAPKLIPDFIWVSLQKLFLNI